MCWMHCASVEPRTGLPPSARAASTTRAPATFRSKACRRPGPGENGAKRRGYTAGMPSTITVRLWQPDATPSAETLAQLWLRSVRATHDFLDEATVLALYPEVRDHYLPAVTLWLAEEASGLCLGFMGLQVHEQGADVAMLFIDPAARGQGLGRRLLDQARADHGALTVDVNEQNPQAWEFYRHYGFEQTGRSPLDGQGRPFPLIHMALRGDPSCAGLGLP